MKAEEEMRSMFRKMVSSYTALTEKEVDIIVDSSDVQFFKKGTILLREGQVSEKCYYVLKGCVREYYLVDGEEKISAFYTENEPVNSFTSSSSKMPSRHYWQCLEDSILTVGDVDLVSAMIALIPRLETIILEEVEKNAGKFQDAHAEYITLTPEERYLNLLEKRPDLLNRVPQYQIASFLGVTPESLSRIRKRILVKR